MENTPPDAAYIYALCEPDTMEVRYIGYTNTPTERAKQHRQEAKMRAKWPMSDKQWAVGKQSPRFAWLSGLYSIGKEPALIILQVCQLPEKDFWEAFWGEIYAGPRLLNKHALYRHRVTTR